MKAFFKRFSPLLGLVGAAALAVFCVCFFGQRALHRPDADPELMRSGAVLSYLRDGQCFSLSDAYPLSWDTAQFTPSWVALTPYEQRCLFDVSERYAQEDVPLLLLWRDGELIDAYAMRDDRAGYPRFEDALGGDSFRLPREEASFLCTFVEDETEGGGYYLCTPAGEAA